jgi:protein-tyrosine phosphatase
MRTELFWIESPWRGRLAMMPRPRGGDWLEEEIQAWRRSGVDVVVSLLTPAESAELNLVEEADLCRANGIEYVLFAIVDRAVPSSMEAFSDLIAGLARQLASGKSVAVHCRQGIGRAAMVAIGLLIRSGVEEGLAIAKVASARGCPVPETSDQRRWITDFAKALIAQRPK